jgi:hypothetical protein
MPVVQARECVRTMGRQSRSVSAALHVGLGCGRSCRCVPLREVVVAVDECHIVHSDAKWSAVGDAAGQMEQAVATALYVECVTGAVLQHQLVVARAARNCRLGAHGAAGEQHASGSSLEVADRDAQSPRRRAVAPGQR